jgi:hypothetical protein
VIRTGFHIAFVLAIGFFVAACGARKEYAVHEVLLDRPSWDSLVVNVEFVKRAAIGGSERMSPDSLMVIAYDAEHDTLFAGPGPGFDVPDHRLGDREGVLVDVCASIRERWICEQTGFRASQKHLKIDADVTYPLDRGYARGRYTMAKVVERDVFNGDGREPVSYDGLTHTLLEAYVDGKPEAAVRVPLALTSGTFDLSRGGGYTDFRFYLDSRLMDHGEATVHFRVLGGLEEEAEPLVHLQRSVTTITREDREINAYGFARQAGQRLVSDLAAFLGGRRTMVDVTAWHYDADERRYSIDMEIEWRGSFFDQRDFRIDGVLTVDENGREAVFAMMGGNRPGVERWDRRMRSDRRSLGSLEVVRPPERHRPGQRSQLSSTF